MNQMTLFDDDEDEDEEELEDDVPAPHNGTETSREAAESLSVTALRARVLEFIQRQGARGATTDEIQVGTGLSHQTACPRVWELAGQNRKHQMRPRIAKLDEKRPTRSGRRATVYVAVEYLR